MYNTYWIYINFVKFTFCKGFFEHGWASIHRKKDLFPLKPPLVQCVKHSYNFEFQSMSKQDSKAKMLKNATKPLKLFKVLMLSWIQNFNDNNVPKILNVQKVVKIENHDAIFPPFGITVVCLLDPASLIL